MIIAQHSKIRLDVPPKLNNHPCGDYLILDEIRSGFEPAIALCIRYTAKAKRQITGSQSELNKRKHIVFSFVCERRRPQGR